MEEKNCLTNPLECGTIRYNQEKEKLMSKLKTGDMIVECGISYIVETDLEGFLWGVSNNAEYEIEIDENFVPDAHFPVDKPS